MKIEDVAKICHEANKALCETQGDNSQKSWDDAEQWQRDSAIKGVQFKIDNPDASPEEQHESWCKAKLDDGWVYGPAKDAELKHHPCLVNYAELPADQQAKDHLFVGITTQLIPFIV